MSVSQNKHINHNNCITTVALQQFCNKDDKAIRPIYVLSC